MIFQFNWFFSLEFEEKERRKTKTKNSFGRVVKLNERPFSMRGWMLEKKCLFCFFFPPYLCFYAKRHGHNAIFWGLHKINLQIFSSFFFTEKMKGRSWDTEKGIHSPKVHSREILWVVPQKKTCSSWRILLQTVLRMITILSFDNLI
jgi:hypothetical protein